MIYTQPGEAFGLYVQIGLIVGIVLASPWIMYQVWLFIAPGLYANEKRFAVPFVLMSTIGFVGGAAFNHYIIFPFMMTFFASFNTADLIFMPRLEDVFDLYSKMLIGMGLVFQMPTVVFFLAKMRLVTARFLLRNTKYAVLVDLRRGGRHHAERRHDHADDLCGADARPLRAEHPDCMDRHSKTRNQLAISPDFVLS